jgi:hypothetical protein
VQSSLVADCRVAVLGGTAGVGLETATDSVIGQSSITMRV